MVPGGAEAARGEGQEAWVGVSIRALIHHVTPGKALPPSGLSSLSCQAGAIITTSQVVEVNKENEHKLK